MKKTLWIFFCLTLVSCTKKPEPELVIRPVMTQTVVYEKEGPPLIFSGFSKSEKFIDVSFRVGGLIEEFPIKVGEKLYPGQLIAQLDEKDFQLEMQKAKSALDEAQADSRKATAQYKRIKVLYESESASRDELDTARAAHEAGKAGVIRATSSLDLKKKDLLYTTLLAERDDCEVTSKVAEVGENVTAGQTIATLSCGRILEVEIAVSETEITKIYTGQKVLIFFNALPGNEFTGKVTEVSVTSEAGTTFPVTVTLDNYHELLRSGMAVKVVIPSSAPSEEPIILVPAVAVGEEASHNYVYVFKATGDGIGVAKKRRVTVGGLRPNGFIITSGLEEGDEVITAGLRYLQDGREVKLLKNKNIIKRRSD